MPPLSGAPAHAAAATPAPRPLLLYFGILPFAAVRQRPQQLALELTRFADVLYVDPPYSVFGAAPLRRLATAIEPLPAALRVLPARAVLPVSGYIGALNRVNGALVATRIRRALHDERAVQRPHAILTSFPKQLHVLPWLPRVPLCYDIMDDYPHAFDRWQGASIRRWQAALVRRADLVVVSSRTLGERYGGAARRLETISNGVGAPFFAACATAAPDPGIAALPWPRFGYVGTVSWWFDFEALERLAAAYPQGSIVLVGPTVTRLPRLPPNVHVLGARPHGALPPVLRALDVGLLPVRRIPVMESANHVKLYEYLAAGLPVVATTTREVTPFAALLELCDAAVDWPAAAARALATPRTPEWTARCRAVAGANLWSDKAAALWRALEARP